MWICSLNVKSWKSHKSFLKMLKYFFSQKANGLNNSASNHKNIEITVIVPSDYTAKSDALH